MLFLKKEFWHIIYTSLLFFRWNLSGQYQPQDLTLVSVRLTLNKPGSFISVTKHHPYLRKSRPSPPQNLHPSPSVSPRQKLCLLITIIMRTAEIRTRTVQVGLHAVNVHGIQSIWRKTVVDRVEEVPPLEVSLVLWKIMWFWKKVLRIIWLSNNSELSLSRLSRTQSLYWHSKQFSFLYLERSLCFSWKVEIENVHCEYEKRLLTL